MLDVSIKDLDVFNKLINVISSERVPESVRIEYGNKILDVTKKD